MKTYDPNEFIKALAQHTNNRPIPQCPYCGGQQFTTTDSLASILIGKETNGIAIGPFVPAGMIICQKCGHIEFFDPKGKGFGCIPGSFQRSTSR